MYKKDYVALILSNEKKFMDSFSWKRVHEHLTSNSILPNSGCKYNMCQMMKENNEYTKYMEEDDRVLVKLSRVSYIRSIDGNTRLMVYNSSNITGLKVPFVVEGNSLLKCLMDV